MKSLKPLTLVVFILSNVYFLQALRQKWGGWNTKEYKKVMDTVAEGVQAGLKECKNQFKWNKWNCTVNLEVKSSRLLIFVRSSLIHANRETAFLHAISAAGVTYWLIRRCRQSELKGCHCLSSVCKNDDYQYGAEVGKHFIDKLELAGDARSTINKHNNEVGRKAVRATLKRRCYCHGVTGSCQTKTCSQRIGDMKEVGDYLKRKYRNAKLARYTNKRKLQFKTTKGFRLVRAKHSSLLYMVSSPDYCVKDLSKGSSGVLGRVCPTNKTNSAQCSDLCRSCGLSPRNVLQKQIVKCHCKFYWCCRVRCKTCQKRITRTVCMK